MASNTSLPLELPPLPAYTLTPRPPLFAPIPDNIVALMLPIIAYWAVSMIFHLIDVYDLFPQYRLHTPAEVLKRNHVTRWDVVRDVVLQQVIQTLAGLVLSQFDGVEYTGREEYDVAVWARRIRIVQRALPGLLGLVGFDSVGLAKYLSGHPMLVGALSGGQYPSLMQKVIMDDGAEVIAPAFAGWELAVASFIYYYFIPALQFIWAVSVVDTWQYFWHRAMHMNRWLYVMFHSRHHRLYVPYAFGALYNHPVEGFLLDTAGTGLGFLTSMMSHRQSMWFFTLSTIKTVDDHCGYAFPWDPLQHLTSNNAAYHDIHHQSWGIKTNFSQPFFIVWDRLMGTQWKGDVTLRYERARVAAQKQVDDENSQATCEESKGEASPVPAPANARRNGSITVSAEEADDQKARTILRKKTVALQGDGGSSTSHRLTRGIIQN
ncbi:sphinganine hydroxylase Sur2, putative [Paecilomyces variotii No. 5]|uniref:Sphinganine hydroxylase Sur2, putative n=1 Tax=Byssochlamys spectabilis (strain No. 5 / NBRC 109023) TaxID=1356009 RepID=V5FX15_BYSSN|nr:sphinganine hydroxylase Sur2, putative [Paecilomyces variotii No. 5]